MDNYLLFLDVSGDLDKSLIDNGISFVPMQFIIDDNEETYTADERGLNLVDFYARINQGAIVKTTQISPYIFDEFFAPYLRNGQSILYLSISSHLSSTFNSAQVFANQVKEKYPNVEFIPIDSLTVTGGMGLLAEKMLENKRKGLSLKENFEDIEKAKYKIRTCGYIDDLASLKRGGRINGATAFVGAILGIKPLCEITESGKLGMFSMQRGSKKSLIALAKDYQVKRLESENLIYIADGCEREQADKLAEEILKINPNAVIKRTPLSPIIGAHVGPGAVIISYYKK